MEGDALYLPLGSVPLIVPLPRDGNVLEQSPSKTDQAVGKRSRVEEPDPKQAFAGLVVHLPFSKSADVACSPTSCKLAASAFQNASQWIAQSILTASGVQAWKSEVDARGAQPAMSAAADGQ